MKQGSANLADTIRSYAKKYQNRSEWSIGKMLDDNDIRINDIVISSDEYSYLAGIDFDEIASGDDVLVFKPNESLIVIIGKVTSDDE